MLEQKQLRNNSGFTLVEIIAVLVILGILAAVAIPRYIDLEDAARQKAVDAALHEINARESLTWADAKLSVSGFVSDVKIFNNINFELDPNFTWNSGDPTVTGGILEFKNEPFTLSRTAASTVKPAVWNR